MGHSVNCAKSRFGFTEDCNCGFEHPLAPWERELIAAVPSINEQIRRRIREITDENTAAHRMIGEAFVDGDKDLCESWAIGVRERDARIQELKNVLSMMEV